MLGESRERASWASLHLGDLLTTLLRVAKVVNVDPLWFITLGEAYGPKTTRTRPIKGELLDSTREYAHVLWARARGRGDATGSVRYFPARSGGRRPLPGVWKPLSVY